MGNKHSRAQDLPVITLGVGLLDKAGPKAFLSPVSIYGALALAANGAGAKSTTHDQFMQLLSSSTPGHHSKISTALHLHSKDSATEAELNTNFSSTLAKLTAAAPPAAAAGGEPDVSLTLASSVWAGSAEVEKAYSESVLALFKAAARKGSAADVNAWVEGETKGKIKSLVDPSARFDVALCTAVHFKGKWLTSFKPEQTRPQAFTLTSKETKDVQMMNGSFDKKDGVKVITCAKHFTAVRLPYRGTAGFFALAVLPEPGTTPLQALKALADAELAKETKSPSKVVVSLPKFKADSTLELGEPLQAMGLKDAFSTTAADFSRLVGAAAAKGLHITQVAHKAVVEVDEEGTVAAAATAVMMNRSLPIPPPDEVKVVFDRPFAFAVMWAGEQPAAAAGAAAAPEAGEAGLPLFMGCVEDPVA